jgi:hypothetical protein
MLHPLAHSSTRDILWSICRERKTTVKRFYSRLSEAREDAAILLATLDEDWRAVPFLGGWRLKRF